MRERPNRGDGMPISPTAVACTAYLRLAFTARAAIFGDSSNASTLVGETSNRGLKSASQILGALWGRAHCQRGRPGSVCYGRSRHRKCRTPQSFRRRQGLATFLKRGAFGGGLRDDAAMAPRFWSLIVVDACLQKVDVYHIKNRRL